MQEDSCVPGKFQKNNQLESVWFGMAWIFLPIKVISLVIREKMALPSSALPPALGKLPSVVLQ